MAPKSASQARKPSSSCGSSPSAMGAATIQNLRGGFSRNRVDSNGLRTGLSQSPLASTLSTA